MKLHRTPIAAALCTFALASAPFALAQDRTTQTYGDDRAGTIDMSSTPGSGGQYSGPEIRNLGYKQADARRLQQALAKRGFDPGPLDGIIGPRTRAAMRGFQQQQNLTGGRFDRETATALGLSDFDDNTVGVIDMSSTPGSGGQYAGPETRSAGAAGVGADRKPSGRGPRLTGDLNDDRAGTIDMSSTPGSGGQYSGPEVRTPRAAGNSGSSAGGVHSQQGSGGR